MIDNPFAMVVLIVLIISIAGVLRARYGIRRDKRGNEYSVRDDAETQRLREEVTQPRDRLAVLERITIEKENSLEREIESLRDR